MPFNNSVRKRGYPEITQNELRLGRCTGSQIMSADATARTIIPTMNRIDRATKRVIRERERREPAARRGRAGAADAAARLDALIETLTRVHAVPYARKDWNEIARVGLREAPPRINRREQAARKALARYEPGVFATLFGLGQDRRRDLAARVIAAAKADLADFERAKRQVEAHNTDVQVAAAVLALDLNAIESSLKANIDREAIGAALEGFAILQAAPDRFIVFIDGLELDALPDEACVVQASGAVTFTPMPAANLHELHLSNICSASLRVGAEVLACLGLDSVEVVTRCHMANPNGRESEQHPVLYVKLPHAALSRMDLPKLEPVSTVTALGGRLDWDVTRGFAPIGIDDLKLYAEAPRQAQAS